MLNCTFMVDFSRYNNEWYFPGSFTKRTGWYLISFFLRSAFPFPNFLKVSLLKLFGCKVGKGVIIKPSVNIKYPWFLEVGDNVWIGEGAWIDNLTMVKIGSNVCISQGAMLLTGNHNYKMPYFDLILGSIFLEDGVWIGARSVVSPNVTCGSHAVLTVGSVATGDLAPYTIYQGNPAKAIRKRVISI